MRASESQRNTNTELTEIAWLSSQNPDQAFHSLMHHFNVGSLRSCFDKLDGKKALGADRVSKEEYGENLEANLEDLIQRMKRMVYPSLIVPKPSVRQIDPNQSKNNIAVSFKNIPVFFS